MSKNKNRQIRQLSSDEDSHYEAPYTSTPSGNMAPPVLDFQTLNKGGKRVIRRLPSTPSDKSNEAEADPEEMDRSSSTSSSFPEIGRIIRHSSQSQPHQVNRQPSARGRGARNSGIPRLYHEASRQPSIATPKKARLVRQGSVEKTSNWMVSSSPEKGRPRSKARDSPPQQTNHQAVSSSPERGRSKSRDPPQVERPPTEKKVKKLRRMPRNTAEKEILRLQRGTDLLIPRLCFSRVVRQVLNEIDERSDVRWTRQAMEALHEASEYFLVQLFEVSYLLTLHARRITLNKKDLQLARRIWGDF